MNRSNQFHQNQFLSRRIFFPTFLGKNLLESSNPRASFPVTVRFGVQWRITRDEIEATAKLGNYPNIPLDVNDAAELAAFAILPLPCVTVLQSRGHKLHETCPLLSAVSRNNFPRLEDFFAIISRIYRRILTENRSDPRYHVHWILREKFSVWQKFGQRIWWFIGWYHCVMGYIVYSPFESKIFENF